MVPPFLLEISKLNLDILHKYHAANPLHLSDFVLMLQSR